MKLFIRVLFELHCSILNVDWKVYTKIWMWKKNNSLKYCIFLNNLINIFLIKFEIMKLCCTKNIIWGFEASYFIYIILQVYLLFYREWVFPSKAKWRRKEKDEQSLCTMHDFSTCTLTSASKRVNSSAIDVILHIKTSYDILFWVGDQVEKVTQGFWAWEKRQTLFFFFVGEKDTLCGLDWLDQQVLHLININWSWFLHR